MIDENSLRQMKLNTKEDAQAYLDAFKAFQDTPEGGSGGTQNMRPASWVPFSVRAPDLFKKVGEARSLLGLNYWQMPYEEAKRKFDGLPFEKWKKMREKHEQAE